MTAVFKTHLDNAEVERIKAFCDSIDYCSLEQSLGFPEILHHGKISYFWLLEDGNIRSYAQINESLRFAHIWYGPVCCDKEILLVTINEIINHYKRRGFVYLGIQLYYKSGYDIDYIEYELSKSHNIKYIFNNENTKSSLEIDLGKPLEEIYAEFRKGHKSDIKRAVKAGLTVEATTDKVALMSFTDIYLKMCKVRGIAGHTRKEMTGIFDYLITNRKGLILVAKDNSNTILGGSIFAYQGISVRYLLGASDPERRDLPVLHPVLYKAIEMAVNDKFKYFDFWGYNHFADESDQANHINHFKRGFGGYYTFFAKKMNISLVLHGFAVYRSFHQVRGLMTKLKRS